MGMRQPSRTAAFFAQAQAGAEEQKKAREQLKKPQAIGGSAGAGTAMVASTTGAQKTATGQVQAAGESAAKDLTIKPENVGSSTVTAIAGTPTTAPAAGQPAAGQPAAAPTTTPVAGIQGPSIDMSQYSVEGKGAEGDVAAVEALGTNIGTTIDKLSGDLTNINNALVTADAQDRAKLSAEKTRIEGLLQEYYDKLNKENLGQIGQSSTLGQQMLEREQLLASEGGDVSKLAALFGGRARKYGGLEAQIYGKDLEAITEAARTGLEEKGLAEQQADTALERYKKQLTTSKAEYEKGLKTEQEKLDYLKATPQELAGVSKSEMYKLFGAETAEKLFDFDDKGFVSGTETAKVREAYAKTIADLGTEKGKIEGELSTAQRVKGEKFDAYNKELFGDQDKPGKIESEKEALSNWKSEILSIRSQLDEKLDSTFGGYAGISGDSARTDTILNLINDGEKELNKIYAKIEKASKDRDLAKLKEYYTEYETYNKDLTKKIYKEAKEYSKNMSPFSAGNVGRLRGRQ